MRKNLFHFKKFHFNRVQMSIQRLVWDDLVTFLVRCDHQAASLLSLDSRERGGGRLPNRRVNSV